MELRLNTPLKFRHPCYEALTWFAAKNYLQEIKGKLIVLCPVLDIPLTIHHTAVDFKL